MANDLIKEYHVLLYLKKLNCRAEFYFIFLTIKIYLINFNNK